MLCYSTKEVNAALVDMQGEQSTWAKLSAIKCNCGVEVCLDKCLRELEHQSRLAREDEAKKRREAGLAPSKIAEEGAAATGESEGALSDTMLLYACLLMLWQNGRPFEQAFNGWGLGAACQVVIQNDTLQAIAPCVPTVLHGTPAVAVECWRRCLLLTNYGKPVVVMDQ